MTEFLNVCCRAWMDLKVEMQSKMWVMTEMTNSSKYCTTSLRRTTLFSVICTRLWWTLQTSMTTSSALRWSEDESHLHEERWIKSWRVNKPTYDQRGRWHLYSSGGNKAILCRPLILTVVLQYNSVVGSWTELRRRERTVKLLNPFGESLTLHKPVHPQFDVQLLIRVINAYKYFNVLTTSTLNILY